MKDVKEGCFYEHKKGCLYKVLRIAKHTETEEILVIYKNAEALNSMPWARPIDMFKDGRFKLVHDSTLSECVICEKCGCKQKPFYFGNLPEDRGVVMDCAHCGHLITFYPNNLSVTHHKNLDVKDRD